MTIPEGTDTHGLMSAPVTAAAMREQLRNEDAPWVWRMLLQGRDHLAEILASGDQLLIDSWEADPGDCGSAGWTTLLAALTTRELPSEWLNRNAGMWMPPA